ncbi:MAG: alpha/beta hydrolase [Chitinispirillaceae bacterium]
MKLLWISTACFLSAAIMFILESVIVVFSPLFKERIPPFDPGLRDDEEKDIQPSKKRENVSFYVENDRIDAYVYLPDNRSRSLACIVMNTGLGGTKDMLVERYAQQFVKEGFAVLTYDYRHFGMSDGTPRQLYSMSKQLKDCAAAVTYARARKEIHEDKIIIWGTSGGGGYGLILAASDERICCVTCQCAALDHKADSEMAIGRDGFLSYVPLLFHGQRDKARQRFGLKPHHLAIVGTPGIPAIIKAPGAYEGYSRIAGENAKNKLCAQIMLTPHKNPIDYAPRVKCPVLIQICENDTIANPRGSLNAAKLLGERAVVKKYPGGHFDIYFKNNFKASVKDQIEFFRKHV